MFVGVPAGIITALLVLLAAFLAALCGPSFREGREGFACHQRFLRVGSVACSSPTPAAAPREQWGGEDLPPPDTCPSEPTGKEVFKTREKPPKVGELPL